MYSRGRQSRSDHPIGIGEPIVNTRSRGPMCITQDAPLKPPQDIQLAMKEVYLFAGIDGTGVIDGEEYDEDFKTSFVNEFCKQRKGDAPSIYKRGPSNDGFTTAFKAWAFHTAIKKEFLSHYEDGKYLKIMLAGYSRGGVAVCAVAKLLGEDNIPVHGLFLFDPVDRTVTIWGKDTVIPKNVSYVVRTQRHSSTNSRKSFGTDCTKYWDGTTVDTKFFETTHGGMGGCPCRDKGEAKYYKGIRYTHKDRFPTRIDGYYKKPPLGGTLDYTKPALIKEGFPDTGTTRLTVAMERIGYVSAQRYFKTKLNDIIGKKASLGKLRVFEYSLAQKKRNKATLEDYHYKKKTGQLWPSNKL